jgi:hypothetical protein
MTIDAPSMETTAIQEQPSIKLGTDSEEEGEVKSIISTPPQDTSNHTSPPIVESSTATEPLPKEPIEELPAKTGEEKVKEFTSAIEEALEDGEIEEGEIADE